MPPTKPNRRKRQPIDGLLLESALYTREGLRRAVGICDEQLLDAQKSGALKFTRFGGRIYYKGSDLIAWVMGSDQQIPPERPRATAG